MDCSGRAKNSRRRVVAGITRLPEVIHFDETTVGYVESVLCGTKSEYQRSSKAKKHLLRERFVDGASNRLNLALSSRQSILVAL
jgi:hypothetical protein